MLVWTSGQDRCAEEPVLVVLTASSAATWTETSSFILCPSHTWFLLEYLVDKVGGSRSKGETFYHHWKLLANAPPEWKGHP